MKKSSEIVSLPVISIVDGNEVGTVKSLIVNPGQKSIDFLTLQHEDWQINAKAIPFKKVIGIGEFAVTVESAGDIIDLTHIPVTSELVTKQIKIIGTKVMTRKGQLLGEVIEFNVDEETGQIASVVVHMQGEDKALPSQYVITLGKELMVVHEDVMSKLSDAIEGDKEANDLYSENSEKEERPTIDPLKMKQIEILEGKEVIKDIYDAQGSLLIPENTVLTIDQIEKAQQSGPSVLVELSMNVR